MTDTTTQALRRAWDDLPAQLQAHPGIKALHRAALSALPAGEPAGFEFGDPLSLAPMAAPAVQAEPDMRHPKIQALLSANARRNIELQLVEQLLDEGPDCDLTTFDMEYWNSLHDKLCEALRRAAPTAQPAPQASAPSGEAVAWLCELMQDDGSVRTQIVTENPDGIRWNDAGEPSPFRVTPLYAAPQAAPAPLPADQVWNNNAIMECNAHVGARFPELMQLVRAIERAHGIQPAKGEGE